MDAENVYVQTFDETIKNFVGIRKNLDMKTLAMREEMGPHLEKIKIIQADLDTIAAKHRDELDKLTTESNGLKEHLAKEWKENTKTIHQDGYVVKRRDLKRLQVNDNILMIKELYRLNKLAEAIKTFDTRFIIKLCEVGVMPAGAAEETIEPSISCKAM